jgi:hypothetical protein
MTLARTLLVGVSILLLALGHRSVGPAAALRSDLPYFSCSTFPANESEADLVTRFGAKNVVDALIEGGGAEGEMNPGTVLFADQSDAKAEISWNDQGAKRNPDWILVKGGSSRWRSPAGVTLGTDLITLEKLNGRPFRLLGFQYDSEGAVTSWAGGKLDSDIAVPACRLKVWLSPQARRSAPAPQKLENQVVGTREYSSGHPAMQWLDPHVYQMFLLYEH